jgi:hypothetical protein
VIEKETDVQSKLDKAVLVSGIDMDTMICDLEGAPIMTKAAKDGDPDKPFTLGFACVEALLLNHPKEEVGGNEKLDRYLLAMRIRQGGRVELSSEEISKIKELVGAAYSPLVSGQAWLLLDPSLKARKG